MVTPWVATTVYCACGPQGGPGVLVGVGLATQLAQVHMTRGLQLESAARATTTGYLQIVFAVLWGAFLLGELPNAWTLAGAIIIIGGTLLLIARKGMEAVPDE